MFAVFSRRRASGGGIVVFCRSVGFQADVVGRHGFRALVCFGDAAGGRDDGEGLRVLEGRKQQIKLGKRRYNKL
eukprot:11225037-Lingulodinium_polyedra.AAC.1